MLEQGQKVTGPVIGPLQGSQESLPAQKVQVIIRILGLLQKEVLGRQTGLLQDLSRTQAGLPAGPVTVHEDDHPVDIATDQLGLGQGQGRAQGGHCMINPRPGQGQNVHVALDQEPEVRSRFDGLGDAEQMFPLLVNQGF